MKTPNRYNVVKNGFFYTIKSGKSPEDVGGFRSRSKSKMEHIANQLEIAYLEGAYIGFVEAHIDVNNKLNDIKGNKNRTSGSFRLYPSDMLVSNPSPRTTKTSSLFEKFAGIKSIKQVFRLRLFNTR